MKNNMKILAVGKFKESNIYDFFLKSSKKIILIEKLNDFKEANDFSFFLFENNKNVFSDIKDIREKNSNALIFISSFTLEKDDLLKSIELSCSAFLLEQSSFKKLQGQVNSAYKTYKKDNIALKSEYFDIANKSMMITKIDRKGDITYVNEKFCEISGYKENELFSKNYSEVFTKKDNERIIKNLLKTISYERKSWEGILKNRIKYGSSYYMKTTIMPIFDENKKIKEFIVFGINISEIMSDRKQLEDDIDANKLSILALVQIDEYPILERFYNYEVINKIEKKFADSLLSKLDNKEIFKKVYFLNNGKYAFLGDFDKYVKSEGNIKKDLDIFVQKVNESILVCDDIEYDLNITLSFSYGKYMLYEDAKHGLENISKTNKFIYDSNDASLRGQKFAKKNMDIIKMVKIALENYNIVTYFQPIINNVTQKIEKYESLVRLIDENYNVISPYNFLQVTKESNYYNKITHRVLSNSFKIIDKINTDVSINLSMLDIEKEETRKFIFSLLDTHKEYSDKIVFELLEDESVKDFSIIKTFIHEVKSRGVKIAIDDFGSGYSSFERLLEFEPDIIKIDGSLVKNIVNDSFSRNIVETIAIFAKKQNIKTIAEFVESKEIYDVLKEIGVDYSQGYYFGKPEALSFS